MSVVVTREEVIVNIKDRIIENINNALLLCGETGYVIERSECGNREIAIELGIEIAALYKEEGYNIDIYEYGTSNREDYIRINISL